jgi:hypothetical protein
MNVTEETHEIELLVIGLIEAFSLSHPEIKQKNMAVIEARGGPVPPIEITAFHDNIIEILSMLRYINITQNDTSGYEFLLTPGNKLLECPDISVIVTDVEKHILKELLN